MPYNCLFPSWRCKRGYFQYKMWESDGWNDLAFQLSNIFCTKRCLQKGDLL